MHITDKDSTTGLDRGGAPAPRPAGETAYDAWLRYAELIHQLRSVHAGLALSTDLLLETAERSAEDEPTGRPAVPALDPGRLLRLQAGEVAHLGRLLEACGAAGTGQARLRRHEPEVDIGEVVDLAVGVARLHGQQVAWGGTSIHRQVAARPAREVLQVLLENARVHAAGARVDLEVVEDGDDGEGVLVRVHDHGPGLSRPRHAPAAGHGLGLGIAAEAAEDLGARLVAEASDEGACFVLVLPARGDAAQSHAVQSHAGTGATSWSACPA